MGRFLSDEANCARARAWVSHELDGELSQLERLFLAAHVRRCGECARFAVEVRSFTQVIRSQPLEEPELTYATPTRRWAAPPPLRRAAIATALVAVAAGLGALVGSGREASSTETRPAVGDVAFVIQKSADRELRDLRRVKVKPQREPIAPPGRLGGFV